MGESIKVTMNVTESELIDLIDQHVNEAVQPYEITIQQYIRAKNGTVDRNRAANILDNLVEQGVLTVRTAYDPTSGRAVKAYRKAEEK